MILVIFGPGGAGKGTLVSRLVEREPNLWLSRSWTTRPPRPGERPEAYTFVDDGAFDKKRAEHGFLEDATFAGHSYGTPWPDPPPGQDTLLEIELQGARQVKDRYPDAVFVLLLPPSAEVQAGRMRLRGDPETRIAERVAVGLGEASEGQSFADHVVVNDDLDRAVDEVASILQRHRSRTSGAD